MTSFDRCPLCQAEPLSRVFPADHEWLVRCPKCGLGMCNPQPTDAELAEIYNADYYTQFGYSAGQADAALAKIKKATYANFLRQAEKLLRSTGVSPVSLGHGQDAHAAVANSSPSLTGGGGGRVRKNRLLDVGCGLGYSLLGGDARGWDAFGLEPHAKAGAGLPPDLASRIIRGTLDTFAAPLALEGEGAGVRGRSSHLSLQGEGAGVRGRNVQHGSPPPHPAPLPQGEGDKSFDLVSLIDVIEHVRDPVATIRQAASLLAPGGVLMLATNNRASRGARRPAWVHFHRAHLWYFSPATLSAAAEQAGLHVCSVATAWRTYNLQYVASILADSKRAGLKRALARLSLKITPRPLRLMSWPALAEGMLLLARRNISAADERG